MNRLMRVVALVLATCSLAACNPMQMRRWVSYHDERPRRAVNWLEWKEERPRAALRWLRANYPPAPLPVVVSSLQGMSDCSQWADEAWAAGWRSDGYTLGWVMEAESNCQPGATSPAGARGLMQVMPFWASHCGGSSGDLYDPVFNLRCALYVLHQQGWTAWDVY